MININYSDLDMDNIAEWPRPAQSFVILVLFVALNCAGYVFYLGPKLDELEQLTGRETELKSTLVMKMHQAAKLPLIESQHDELQARVTALSAGFPEQKELSSLLAAVNDTGLQSNLTFTSMEWGDRQEQTLFFRLPLHIELTGNYDNIADFSQNIAALPRLILFEHALWQRVSQDSQILRFRVKAYTYQLKQKER